MRNTIIIADANEMNVEILEEQFSEEYAVLTADTGKSALELINANYKQLACVLLDNDMEDLGGVEILGAISAQPWFANVPIVMLSSDTSLKTEKALYKAGATDFFKKPFDSSLIKRKVTKYAELYGVKEKLYEAEINLKEMATCLEKSAKETEVNSSAAQAGSGSEFVAMHNNMIELIGTLVEFRNPENQQHVRRMKGLVKIMAKNYLAMYPTCGLNEDKINDIVTACSIHDIGKIAVPDTILLKPGRLTNDEYELMKSHTLRGIDILNEIPGAWSKGFDAIVRQVVRSHHEKYDGGGYPDGIRGDDIPLSAQLVSICDTYDALVNDRIYKKAFPKDVAFEMIVTGDCGVFPPKIIECFRTCADKMVEWEEGRVTFSDL